MSLIILKLNILVIGQKVVALSRVPHWYPTQSEAPGGFILIDLLWLISENRFIRPKTNIPSDITKELNSRDRPYIILAKMADADVCQARIIGDSGVRFALSE